MTFKTRIFLLLCPFAVSIAISACDSQQESSNKDSVSVQDNESAAGASEAPAAELDQDRLNKVCLEAQARGSCEDSCGEKSKNGCCYCDDQCERYDDCCDDYVEECVEDKEESCGGKHNRRCSDRDDFCFFEAWDNCGERNEQGVCRERPDEDHCSDRYDPVCGCDGETYRNECLAHAHGVSVEHEGRCEPKECGGRVGDTCNGSEFCSFEQKAKCGRVRHETGLCEDRPDSCNKKKAPVCGCNGRTYRNECRANKAGFSILHEGACRAAKGDDCGGKFDIECERGLVCDFRMKDNCGVKHKVGVCVKRKGGCDDHYAPVCGCDNVTYANACQAENLGLKVQYQGACN